MTLTSGCRWEKPGTQNRTREKSFALQPRRGTRAVEQETPEPREKLALALDVFEHQEPLDPTKISLDGFRTSRFARFFEPAIFRDGPRKEISESVAFFIARPLRGADTHWHTSC